MSHDWRNDEFEDLPRLTKAILGTIVVIVVAGIGYAVSGDQAGLGSNLFTEMIGILITILVLNTLAARRADSQLKAELIRDMGAIDNGITFRAAKALRAYGWLQDGSLQHKDLRNANLQWPESSSAGGTALERADMRGAFFQFARLRRVPMECAKLQKTDFWHADMRSARLNRADFSDARLNEVDLENALLGRAVLRGANLNHANLKGAYLHEAEYDHHTTLPDRTSWTPDVDMDRFTDPGHPDFWRPQPGSVWWYPDNST